MLKQVQRLLLVIISMLMAFPIRAETQTPPPHLGYGMMLAYPPGNLAKAVDAGFDWFKYFVRWEEVDPEHDGVYDWTSVDTQLDGWACPNEINILMRVERSTSSWLPIQDHEMAGWQAFFQALAERVAQRRAACGDKYRVAFEIWNEPNLDFQWNYEPVDPVRYTEMVKRAYVGTKAGDSSILVVAGSLAPTGGDGTHAMNDVDFLEAMYANGIQGYFDAISIHNYGFGGEPEDKDYGWDILNFRRAEDIYAVMVVHGDGDKAVWGTEFGWLLDAAEEGVDCASYWQSIGFDWQKVSAQNQADYLQRAFAYADENWPWMGVMVVSNLDFSTTGWYQPACNPLNWFSVLKPDTSPRLAYNALRDMPKRKRAWDAWGMAVDPEAFSWSMRLRDLGTFTDTVTVLNTGTYPFDWDVVTSTAGLPFTVVPTMGAAGESFDVRVEGSALMTGTYTGTVTVNALSPEVEPQAITIPLELDVWGLWGMGVQPAGLSWMMAISDTYPVSATAIVVNTGDFPFDWTVEATSESLTVTVVPTSSLLPGTLLPGTFEVAVDPCGLSLGVYTGVVTVTASTSDVPESPFAVPVTVRIVERLYRVYMPLVMRGVDGKQ